MNPLAFWFSQGKLTNDNMARSTNICQRVFSFSKDSKDRVEQSIKSTLRTMRILVYKRRSKRIPGTTAESVAAT